MYAVDLASDDADVSDSGNLLLPFQESIQEDVEFVYGHSMSFSLVRCDERR